MKTCIITGAASGTGFAVAQRFARGGFSPCVTSRDGERALIAACEITRTTGVPARGARLDPQNGQDVDALFRTLDEAGECVGAVVLVAADLGIGQNALTTPLADWQRVLDVNVVWNFSIARAAAQRMKDSGGAIVFIGSNTATRAITERSAYIASKGALEALSRALSVEWGAYGIRSNVLVSGNIKNERYMAAPEAVKVARRARCPLNDFADYSDIAEAAYFLGSDLSRVITGASLTVDGGVLAQLSSPDSIAEGLPK